MKDCNRFEALLRNEGMLATTVVHVMYHIVYQCCFKNGNEYGTASKMIVTKVVTFLGLILRQNIPPLYN